MIRVTASNAGSGETEIVADLARLRPLSPHTEAILREVGSVRAVVVTVPAFFAPDLGY